jgi:GT2 family glycosyltransferase
LARAAGITVIVATWRRPAALRRCLAGLSSQSLVPTEVLVAVRREDGEGHAVVADFPLEGLRPVLIDRPGVVAARNAGIAESNGHVIAFIDDDAVPRADWLERLAAHYADRRVGAVGGRDFVYHEGTLEVGERAVVGRVLPYGRFVGFHHLGVGSARPVDFLKGVNMSVRKTALDGRGFDPELRGEGAEHHEDWTLTLRIKRGGWRVVYDPSVNVDHYEAARTGGAPRVDPEGQALIDRLHNQTYAAVRYLPLHLAAAHVAFAFLVGTGVGPGLVQGVLRAARTRQFASTGRLLRASTSGRVAGIASGLHGRKRDSAVRVGY